MQESEQAKQLLRQKEQGYSIVYLLKKQVSRYLFSLILMAILVLIVTRRPAFYPVWVGIGIYLGSFVRDYSWHRSVKKCWPLTVKIVNWDKVQAIAEQE